MILDISERVDESCQTPKEFFQPIENKQKKIDQAELEKVKREVTKRTEDEWKAKLEQEQKRHQIELRKTKKKQWCAVCAKEGTDNNPNTKLLEL